MTFTVHGLSMEIRQSCVPRKKHSHRCKICGEASYCYKKHCQKPQRIVCTVCSMPKKLSVTPEKTYKEYFV